MSNFVIPKSREYVFTVKVLDKNSFLPRDLTTMTSITVTFLENATNAPVVPGSYTIATSVLDSINGLIKVVIPAGYSNLLVSDRGDKVDGYYLKPTYKCIITVKFSNDSDVLSIIDKVYVLPVG